MAWIMYYIKNTNVKRDNSIVYIGKTAVIFVVIACSTTFVNASELIDFSREIFIFLKD